MRRELLKILTEKDIDEILETEKSLWRDTAIPTSGDVLKKSESHRQGPGRVSGDGVSDVDCQVAHRIDGPKTEREIYAIGPDSHTRGTEINHSVTIRRDSATKHSSSI